MKKIITIALLFLGLGISAQNTSATFPSKQFGQNFRQALKDQRMREFSEEAKTDIEKIAVRQYYYLTQRINDEILISQVDSIARLECILLYNSNIGYVGGFKNGKTIQQVSTNALLAYVILLRTKLDESVDTIISEIESELQLRYKENKNEVEEYVKGLEGKERNQKIIEKFFIETIILSIVEPQ